MENHPIPQDITGFQFKLIGDMTIKQFAYLAAGVILGWITFILPIFILIKLPIALVFIGLGVASAFLPIEGRPFDVMISNYFKALFNPTRYIYQKTGGHFWFPDPPRETAGGIQKPTQGGHDGESAQRLRDFLKTLPQKPKSKLDEKEMNFLNSLFSLPSVASKPSEVDGSAFKKLAYSQNLNALSPTQAAEEPSIMEERGESKLEEKEIEIKKELEEAKMAEKTQSSSPQYEMAHKKVLDLENILSDVLSQKQALENQIAELKRRLEMQNQKVFTPTTAIPKQETKSVRMVPKQMGKIVGLPFIPDVPNLIMGIIKDPRNNPLPNILVEVKDASGNPVRAFKTNVLGQFASATPLGNGTYTISFEDPKEQNKFDTIEVKVVGEVIMPIEVISLDSREELRRSLFNPVQKS